MSQKKQFFEEKTAAEIKRYDNVREVYDELIRNVEECRRDSGLIIKTDLIPEEYESSRKFLKHGRDLKIPRTKSLTDAINKKLTPSQLRASSFDKVQPIPYSKYSFKPFIGSDKRIRNISLVEDLEGILLWGYTHQDIAFKPQIIVTPYDKARRVEYDGAEIMVKVPSRTKGHPNYEIKFGSVPTVDSLRKWGIANSIVTNHSCKRKTFNIKYTKETSRQFNFCAHEIAGYMGIMDHFINEERNIIPLQMNQFALPRQSTVNFYKKLENNCLIQTSKDKSPRKLNKAEKEIMLWGLVYKKGHDKTFSIAGEGKIKDYDFK